MIFWILTYLSAAEVELPVWSILAETSEELRLETEMTFEDELSGAKCDWYFRYDR